MSKDDKGLSKYEPRGPVSLREAMGKLFDESFWDPFDRDLIDRSFADYPKVDISETDKEVRVTANVAGVDPDQLEIEVEDDVLLIKGQIDQEKEDKDEKFYRYEREFGQFNRSFVLPARVDESKVKAEIKDGVLRINLPKTKSKDRKKIKVNKS